MIRIQAATDEDRPLVPGGVSAVYETSVRTWLHSQHGTWIVFFRHTDCGGCFRDRIFRLQEICRQVEKVMLRRIGFAFVTFLIFGVMIFVGLVGILELLEVLQIINDNPVI